MASASLTSHRRGPWSQREDLYLMQLVSTDGASNWVRISHAIGTRSPKQCRERYHQNLKPTLNHDPITPEEGEQIEKMVNEMGKRWAEIARRLKGRSDNAVKNWWNGGQNRRRRGHDHRRSDSEQNLRYHDYPPNQFIHPDHDYRRQSLPTLETGRFAHDAPFYPSHRLPFHLAMNHMQPYPTAMPHYAPNRMHPSPLSISVQHEHQNGMIEPPVPSPAGSYDAPPSLVTDTGSESRSPNHANSPQDLYPLQPSMGVRQERRRSSIRFPLRNGFYENDDLGKVHLAPITQAYTEAPKAHVVPAPLQLPSPQCMVKGARAEQHPPLPSPRELINNIASEKNLPRDFARRNSQGASPAEPKKMALASILA